MRAEDAPMIRLEDYRPSDWLIDTVDLDILLDANRTLVRSLLKLRPNPQGRQGAPLVLDGDELALGSIALDDVPLAPTLYTATPQSLTLPSPPDRAFSLRIETELNPAATKNPRTSGASPKMNWLSGVKDSGPL